MPRLQQKYSQANCFKVASMLALESAPAGVPSTYVDIPLTMDTAAINARRMYKINQTIIHCFYPSDGL